MTGGKNEKIKKLLFCLLFLILLFLCFMLASRLVERKDSRAKNGDFFEAADQVDLLLLGSSHMINGVNAAQLYEEYGIAAYNLGGHGNTMQVTYWELMNALDYASPSYVVLDVYMLERDYQYIDLLSEQYSDADRESSISQLHEVMDVFPLTTTKMASLRDLISDPEVRAEFYLNFIRYHGRWSQLDSQDYQGVLGEPESTAILGAQMRYEVGRGIETYDLLLPSDKMELDTVGVAYLRRIIETCLERGIYPLLVQIPYSATEELQRIANYAQDIADEYGIAYVNMKYVEDIINPETDQQSQTHLNVLGASKTTAYLGQVLSEGLAVPDRRNEDGYELWEEAVEAYHEELLKNLLQPTDLYTELLLLQTQEVGAILFINNDSVAFRDPTMLSLISQLSGEDGIYTMSEISDRAYCLILDPTGGVSEELAGVGRIEDLLTSFGSVSFTSLEDYALLTVGEDTDVNSLDYVNNFNVDAQILLFDTDSGAQIGHLLFEDSGLIQR